MNSHKKIAYIPAAILMLLSIGFLITGLVIQNSLYIKESVLIIATVALIVIAEEKTKLQIPYLALCCLFVFLFFAMVLGKMLDFYHLIPLWDKYLHVASGILIVPFGYAYYLKMLKSSGQEKPYPTMAFWYCLIFAIAAAGVWEIFEYSGDQLFGLTSQNNSLHDTMQDIICGSIGGLFSSIYLLVSLKFGYRGYHQHLEAEITGNEFQQTEQSV